MRWNYSPRLVRELILLGTVAALALLFIICGQAGAWEIAACWLDRAVGLVCAILVGFGVLAVIGFPWERLAVIVRRGERPAGQRLLKAYTPFLLVFCVLIYVCDFFLLTGSGVRLVGLSLSDDLLLGMVLGLLLTMAVLVRMLRELRGTVRVWERIGLIERLARSRRKG